MSLEMFYATIGGDFDGVKSRLLTEERIEKFVNIFFDDPTYSSLEENLNAGNLQEAFRAAHTLKGVSRDVGLTTISDPATELADALRPDDSGAPADLSRVPELMDQVKDAYQRAAEARELISL